MNRLYRNEQGMALLVTLLILVMLSMITILAVNTADTDMELSFNQLHEDQAFYIAEAGAKRALLALNENNAWRDGYVRTEFGKGMYSVQLVDSTVTPALYDTVVIDSRGVLEDAASLVELWTVPEYRYPFKYAMFAEAGIKLDQATCTDSYNSDSGSYATTVLDSAADIGSNGTITSAKHVNFGGGITSATPGGITLGANNTVNGDTTSTADSVTLDFVSDSEYVWAAANSNAPAGLSGFDYHYNNGSKELVLGANAKVILESGVYYFSAISAGQLSQIELAPGASVTIYVAGDIALSQGTTVNALGTPSDLTVYSRDGSLLFDQDNIFVGAFYGPNAHIQYDQTTQVFGALVGNTIQMDQGACLHYDRFLSQKVKGTTGRMIALAWRGR